MVQQSENQLTPFEMAEAFHDIFDPRKPDVPTAFTAKEALHRADFKVEELVEFLYAAAQDHKEFDQLVQGLHESLDKAQRKVLAKESTTKTDPLVAQADALVDLLYLTYGSFSLMGVDPAPIMAIVHEANLAKRFPDGEPHYDPVTNKVLKPENWNRDFAPEEKIAAEIARQKEVKKQGL